MDAFSQFSFRPKSYPFRPPLHDHRRFQHGEIKKDHSVSTSNLPPRAAQLKPQLQTYFPPSAPLNFNQHFADSTASPYSSGSSSSFPNESPPAEPPFDMEPDYTPMISSSDDIRFSYPSFDQGDPAEWPTKGLNRISSELEIMGV